MKISFEIDILKSYPETMKALAWALYRQGHAIGVITSHKHDTFQVDQQFWANTGMPPATFWKDSGMSGVPGSHREWKVEQTKLLKTSLHFDTRGLMASDGEVVPHPELWVHSAEKVGA